MLKYDKNRNLDASKSTFELQKNYKIKTIKFIELYKLLKVDKIYQ